MVRYGREDAQEAMGRLRLSSDPLTMDLVAVLEFIYRCIDEDSTTYKEREQLQEDARKTWARKIAKEILR